MSKYEFLTVLRGQITGQIPTNEVESQVNYYEAYIDGQLAKGLSEESIIEEIGDPRLIAKTLIDSTNRAAEEAGYDGPYRTSTDTYDDSDGINSGIFGSSQPNNGYGQANNGYSRPNSGYGQENNDYSRQGADRTAGGSSSVRRSGIGCGILLLIVGIIVVLGIGLVFSLIRFSIRNFGSILLIGGIVAGMIVLIRYIGRR